MEIVRYWWTHDGDEELCIKEEGTLLMPMQCENCSEPGTIGSKMIELTPLSANTHAKGYFLCKKCFEERTEEVPGRNSIDYKDLIELLKNAKVAKEIMDRKYEIGALLPSVYIMFGYNQQNAAHQYDLWEHCVHTVINLPKDIDDDMLYLAALLHDIGKPDCWCWGKREDDPNMHYYGHPVRSMEIVRDEVLPCLEAAGICLTEEDRKRLLYYVEYHDYRMSHREKHIRKHLEMVNIETFRKLMLLQIADAKAHVQLPVVVERIRVCEEWYMRAAEFVKENIE